MKIRQVAITLVAIAILLTTSGCMAVVHDVIVGSKENADKVLSELQPVQADKSRVVLYMKRLPMGGIGPFGSPGGVLISVLIKGEQGSTKVDVLDKTAEVADLPAGKYVLETPKIGVFGNDSSLDIDLKNGQTYFVKIEKNKQAKLVPNDEAYEEIRQADIRSDVRNETIMALTPKTGAEYIPYSSEMSHKELTSLAMQFNPPPDRSRIYIMKYASTPCFGQYMAGLDCKANRKMKRKTFLCYDVAPGEHTVTFGHALNKSIKEAYSINTVGGKCYFFEIIWAGSTKQGLISEEKGKKQILKSKLQKNGFLKSVP